MRERRHVPSSNHSLMLSKTITSPMMRSILLREQTLCLSKSSSNLNSLRTNQAVACKASLNNSKYRDHLPNNRNRAVKTSM